MSKAKKSTISSAEANPADLLPNPWNSNHLTPESERQLEASIERLGCFKPIIVREITLDGAIHLQIIGGQHRAAAAERKHFKTVPIVNLGPIDDQRAKEIGLVDNARYGADNVTELADILKSFGDLAELQSFLPYTDEDVGSIFAGLSINLDELKLDDDFNLVETTPEPEEPRTPKVARTHALMKFKVAIADAERIAKMIADVKVAQGFTVSDELTNAGDALAHILLTVEDHG